MTVLLLPFRIAGALLAWAVATALVVVLDAVITHGHPPGSWLIGMPIAAVIAGVVAGVGFWRSSGKHMGRAAGLLAVLILAFAATAVAGGAAAGR